MNEGRGGGQKQIRLTRHAREQMLERGASEDDVIDAIRNGETTPAKRGRIG